MTALELYALMMFAHYLGDFRPAVAVHRGRQEL
ncbi:hypothetical protein GGE12_006751 [Rhizobium mongolense]|uniref:Uncharacterized protein n=1 Tax=Rhizobium mongolense TaxID=57676 RepID=A0A7W6RUS1_9HYPH|nr:hypothetical protein [Rhizobium mongolense]